MQPLLTWFQDDIIFQCVNYSLQAQGAFLDVQRKKNLMSLIKRKQKGEIDFYKSQTSKTKKSIEACLQDWLEYNYNQVRAEQTPTPEPSFYMKQMHSVQPSPARSLHRSPPVEMEESPVPVSRKTSKG